MKSICCFSYFRLFISLILFPVILGQTDIFAFEPMASHEIKIVQARLTPLPVEWSLGKNDILLNDQLEVTLELKSENADQSAVDWVRSRFKAWFKSNPIIRLNTNSGKTLPSEGYELNAEKNKLVITATSMTGIRYALYTLRQMAEVLPGTRTVQDWFVPEHRIKDYPAIGFRGLHLCWMPETSSLRMEQAIRLAASYKFNYIILEFWGVFSYKTLPEFGWSELKVSEQEIRNLVRLGKDLGVTLIPQFNLFGHASASRNVSGKHALLDLHPEFASLFEPDGWTWCLSNKETQKILDGIVLELLDVFDHPKFFHLGCDEAYSAGTCKLCRHANYKELLYQHLCHFNDLLKSHNARPMMWHDMLIAYNPRWKGFIASGNEKTEGLLERLPRDFIICDWQYGSHNDQKRWPTMDFFKEKGFDVVACPWRNMEGIRSQAKQAIKEQYMGVICTTWNYFFGFDMFQNGSNIFVTGATSLWGTEEKSVQSEKDIQNFNAHLRQVGWDMKNLKYNDTGTEFWQVKPQPACP